MESKEVQFPTAVHWAKYNGDFLLEIWEGAKQVKRVGHTAEHRILGWDVYKIWECPLI